MDNLMVSSKTIIIINLRYLGNQATTTVQPSWQEPTCPDEMVGLDGPDTVDKPNEATEYSTTVGL